VTWRPSLGDCNNFYRISLRSGVAGNLSRRVAGNGPDRVGGRSDRDQRVRGRPVAQNPPAAVADDFVSVIVENSDAVRLEVNPVCRIGLDRRASVSVSDIDSTVFDEDAVRGIRSDNGARIQDSGPAIEDGDAMSRIVGNDAAREPNRAAEYLHAIARVRPDNAGAGDKRISTIADKDTVRRIALDRCGNYGQRSSVIDAVLALMSAPPKAST